uniref:Serine/threonine-protein phosphatase n=1 Tax=Parascaris univalens TaxID=6257 RepID=A0A915B7F2_PARUN
MRSRYKILPCCHEHLSWHRTSHSAHPRCRCSTMLCCKHSFQSTGVTEGTSFAVIAYRSHVTGDLFRSFFEVGVALWSRHEVAHDLRILIIVDLVSKQRSHIYLFTESSMGWYYLVNTVIAFR